MDFLDLREKIYAKQKECNEESLEVEVLSMFCAYNRRFQDRWTEIGKCLLNGRYDEEVSIYYQDFFEEVDTVMTYKRFMIERGYDLK